MKTLPQKVQQVKKVYARLDAHIDSLQNESGLRCISGCGQCCKKPDVEASPVEFLPLALEWFDQDIHWDQYEQLQSKADPTCFVFRPNVTSFGGLCNAYPNRGLICRLFGYSARINKEEKKELVTCKILKEEMPNEVAKASDSGKKLPVMVHYHSRMSSIDIQLNDRMPINKAMQKAIETVAAYYAYRKRRKPNKV
ncbi:MAG: hypothetical protein RL106_1474 [Bacteroidota bacterium]|jgi:Fe-S-cluster containining protein